MPRRLFSISDYYIIRDRMMRSKKEKSSKKLKFGFECINKRAAAPAQSVSWIKKLFKNISNLDLSRNS